MKLSRKLVMVSAAALMSVSPLAAPVVNSTVAQAATKKSSNTVHKTYGKNSKVTVTKGQNFVNENGKKTSKKAPKGGEYIIWDVKEINGEVYYSIQTDLKYWIPAVNTKGSVQYKTGSTTVTLKTDGKKVVQTESSAKKSTKETSKKTAKSDKKETKATKKSESKADSKKESAKKSAKETSKKTAKSDKKETKATKKSESKADSKKESAKKSAKETSKKESTKKSAKKAIKPVKITATKKTPVVDKNGKKVKTYMGSKKYTIIGKGITVNGLGTKKIDGKTYYALQPDHYYVLASDFKTAK